MRMHRGILLSFYSSAAVFVNGKCACFLPGFLGRAQKPRAGQDDFECAPRCSAHIQRKNYFYFAFVALCGALQTHFHGGGVATVSGIYRKQDRKKPRRAIALRGRKD